MKDQLTGRELVEGDVTMKHFAEAEEVFCSGTAAVISPICHVGESVEGSKHQYNYKPMVRARHSILSCLI